MIDARVETEPLLREASTSDLYPEAMESSEIRQNDDGPEGEEGSDQNNRSQGGALHMERNHKHATSNMETMIHLLKGNIGTGVQAMPDALKNSGLAFGSIGVVLMGVVCIHCMHMLVDACHELCGRLRFTSMDYADVSFHAFRVGPEKWRKFAVASRRIVNVFLCLTQFGFCCVYYVYVAKNLQTFMTDHVQFDMSVHAYMGIIFIPFALLTFVKSLKYLSPISMIANVLQAVGTAIIFYFLLRDLKPVGDRPMVAPISRWPLYFGTAIYAFEGIGIVLPLENKMKTPRDFVGWTGVLNTGMVIVTCLYTATGFFGYLEYGDDVKGSVTLNLPPGNIWAAAVQLMMTLAIFFSYALQFYVPVEILWPHVKARLPNEQYSVLTNFLFRIALVFMTFALAALIPNIGLFISLVGAVSSSFLALIFPPILDSVVFWNEVSQVRLCKNIAITLFGILGFVTGTYATLAQVFTGDDTI